MKRRKPKQQTLEDTLGRPRTRQQQVTPVSSSKAASSPVRPTGDYQTRLTRNQGPPARFLPQHGARGSFVLDDSDDDDSDDEPLPARLRSSPAKPATTKAGPADDDDDSDDVPQRTPISSFPRKRQTRTLALDDEDESDDDVQTAAKRRRLTRNAATSPLTGPGEAADASGDDDVVIGKSVRLTSSVRGSRKGARGEKRKKMELLRRRRLGQKLDEEDITSSSSDGEPRKAVYDADSDLPALDEFDDEEEEEDEEEHEPDGPSSPPRRKKTSRTAVPATANSGGSSNDEGNLDDFVVDDEDDLLGAPASALEEMPLEFTRHSHKPLKEHFKDAIEWLVHRRINPSFDKDDALYRLAWRKLDDEVLGLANSQFMSAGWKPEFHAALRARPYLESYELPRGDPDRLQVCQACGRSGHPATWKIHLTGTPYRKDSLDDVETDSEDGSEWEDDAEVRKTYDEHGNAIEPESREWFVGVTCNSNAETAHKLIHVSFVEPCRRVRVQKGMLGTNHVSDISGDTSL